MKLGIIGAMPEEIVRIAEDLEHEKTQTIAGREYHIGRFNGIDTVLVFSRWGKVAAAATATALIERFQVDCIIFTGVAGAVSTALQVGDVVIADRLIQHDFDVSAAGMLPKFAIPFLGISYFTVEERLVELARTAAEEYLNLPGPPKTSPPPPAKLTAGAMPIRVIPEGIRTAKVHIGTIASGDQFIAHPEKLETLRVEIPNLLCVEMEGAAVAQVCHEYQLPYLVIRAISDKADHSAPMDFLTFVNEVARHYSHGILTALVPRL
ncbi:MAG: 5'-methylthioadenosine/adenosylhomocysteine nucleosidase [Acidobacteriaceae bacterium]